ncbi:hypothetical protein D3C76_592770 [compost metagenome]
MALVPAFVDRRQHAHRLDDLGVAQVVVGIVAGGEGGLVGFGQGFLRGLFGEVGQRHEDQRADQRHQAEQRVDQVGHQQVDRRPGRIEEGEQAIAGEKLPDLRQILQGLGRVAARAIEVALEGGGEHAAVEVHVDAVADPYQHAGADHLQARHQQEQPDHQERQHGQGGDVATDQRPVVHLQHVDRWRQHHDVDDAAEAGE